MSQSMKISDLKPCVMCGGKIVPTFSVVKVTRMVVNTRSINQTLGLNTFFGGKAMRLAEVFTADTEAAKKISTDDFIICDDCLMFYCGKLSKLLKMQE